MARSVRFRDCYKVLLVLSRSAVTILTRLANRVPQLRVQTLVSDGQLIVSRKKKEAQFNTDSKARKTSICDEIP